MSELIENRSLQYAQAIAKLVRRLPVERAAEVYDFARFLQTQAGSSPTGDLTEEDWLNDSEEQMQAEDEIWEATFSRRPDTFLALAVSARAEIAAGLTQPMFDEQGEIVTDELAHDARFSRGV